jgi:hypothetical protein
LPKGSVEFYDGSTDLGAGSALSGSGTKATSSLTSATLTPEAHSIRAVYMATGILADSTGTLIQAINPALVTVQSVAIAKLNTGKHKTTQVIVLHFSGALNAMDAADLGNYSLVTVAQGKKHPSKAVALLHASYSAANHTMTLTTRKKLVLSPPVRLTLNSVGLVDTLGRALDGNDDGIAGGNFVATLSPNGVTVASAVPLNGASGPSHERWFAMARSHLSKLFRTNGVSSFFLRAQREG